ncbi:MAG: hypothetical protein M5R36_03650 [Deltaproteobacteria bacterium]|nr:hypothetical protein [Deltaproteobacteria bacterium]
MGNGHRFANRRSSHTAPGAAFLDHEWLARLILYGLDRAAGIPGLVALKGLMILLTFGLLAWTMREDGLAAALVMIAAGFVAVTRVQMRPHLMSWVLIGALLVFQKGNGRRRSFRFSRCGPIFTAVSFSASRWR